MTRMLAVAVTIAACARAAEAQRDRAASTPLARMVRVAHDVSLEVLDWGGKGPALVFLAGLGNTAHAFDEFAPQFADSFHVIGITRRGFGASAGSPPPRELDTLVADITTILDSANISTAILVGHSIAGEEMTRFAEVHPQRCRGLIYIDAAYDRSGIDTLARRQPSPPGPRIHSADTASLAGVRAFHERVMGVREPESEIRATSRFDGTGRYRGEVTADSLKARIVSGSRVARYDRAHCAALGIFAMADSLGDVIPYYSELDVAGRAKGDSVLKFVQSVVADARNRFASFPQNTVVEVSGGNHFLFLQRPVEVARVMRDFLSGLPKYH